MIYQLKVTLAHSKPSIWRRLHVHGDITFYQLHEILQIAFKQPHHFFARISEQQDGQLIWRDGSVSALPVAEEEPEVLAVPEKIYVQRENARRVLQPLCEKLGIELALVQELPLINQVRPEMIEMMNKM